MEKWIEDLLALQETDLRIRNLKARLEMLPIEAQRLDKENANEKKKLEDAKEVLLKHELELKKLESAIKEKNTEMQKLQTQSAMIKKNDEYRAMLNEIENVRKKISDIETEELILMDKLEEEKKKFKQAEKECADRIRSINEEKAGLSDIEKQIKTEIEKLNLQSEERKKNVPKECLTPYLRLLSKGNSTPFVPVSKGICGNCHLKITPQTLNTARKGIMTFCDNCSHLIYFKEE